MIFKGNYLSISDTEFGCTLSIAENEEKEHAGDAEKGSAGNYLLLQRAYAEEAIEKEGPYIESNIEGVSGFHKDVIIELYSLKLLLSVKKTKIDIMLSNNTKFKELKNALQKIGKNAWKITIHDNE